MAYPFERTLRSLNYESDTRLVFVALMVLCAGGLIAWSLFAKVPLVKASSQARIEPHNAVYRIEPPSAGRVVRSLLKLDQEVKEGDLLIEFDARAERLELERSKATLAATEKELAIIRQQITNKREEAALTARVDEVAVKEALEREQELAPRHRLAVERAQLALKSPTGAVSEMEKLERTTDVDALRFAQTAQGLALIRLRREQNVRRQALAAQLLELEREELGAEGRIGSSRAPSTALSTRSSGSCIGRRPRATWSTWRSSAREHSSPTGSGSAPSSRAMPRCGCAPVSRRRSSD